MADSITCATSSVANAARFSSILVARANNARPSELEVHLRQHCQRMRVHSHLSGAHMIIPQEHGLAIRVYYPINIQRLEASPPQTIEREIKEILDFSRHFQWSITFFVVPNTSIMEKNNSFIQRAMDGLLDVNCPPNKQPPRMMVVANTEQVMVSILTLAENITPHRCKLRQKFARKIRLSLYCDTKGDSEEIENRMQANAASQLATAVRTFAENEHFPEGEADILLRVFGNLSNFANANAKTLQNIPVEARTQREIMRFFSATDDGPEDVVVEHSPMTTRDENNGEYINDIISPPPLDNRSGFAAMPFPSANNFQGIDYQVVQPSHFNETADETQEYENSFEADEYEFVDEGYDPQSLSYNEPPPVVNPQQQRMSTPYAMYPNTPYPSNAHHSQAQPPEYHHPRAEPHQSYATVGATINPHQHYRGFNATTAPPVHPHRSYQQQQQQQQYQDSYAQYNNPNSVQYPRIRSSPWGQQQPPPTQQMTNLKAAPRYRDRNARSTFATRNYM